MCGIAGALQQPDGKVVVTAMTDRLGHRGPDASGVLELVSPDSAVVLGHRRLSIIDLSSAADQPFSKGGLTLAYNGEIYNHSDLRRELEARGVQFSRTRTPRSSSRPGACGAPRRCGGSAACSPSPSTTNGPAVSRSRATRWASSPCMSWTAARASCSPR